MKNKNSIISNTAFHNIKKQKEIAQKISKSSIPINNLCKSASRPSQIKTNSMIKSKCNLSIASNRKVNFKCS